MTFVGHSKTAMFKPLHMFNEAHHSIPIMNFYFKIVFLFCSCFLILSLNYTTWNGSQR